MCGQQSAVRLEKEFTRLGLPVSWYSSLRPVLSPPVAIGARCPCSGDSKRGYTTCIDTDGQSASCSAIVTVVRRHRGDADDDREHDDAGCGED
jgi:hypothetical protein